MKTCLTCRYWSDMLAQVFVSGPLHAYCLSDLSWNSGLYMTAGQSCEEWRENKYGAVDSPPDYGETARARYEQEGEL